MQAKDIAKLIELEKRKAGLELKKSIGVECEAELKSMGFRVDEAASKARQAGVDIVYPRQDRLDELDAMLKPFTTEQIKEALTKREGEGYELLTQKAKISKANLENRFEIAKLVLVLAKMDRVEKEKVVEAVRAGSFEIPLKVGSLDEKNRKRLSRFLCRCGIGCSVNEAELSPDEPADKEVSMRIDNEKVWVDRQTSKQLKGNLKRMEELGSALQVSNAKRQIMEFDEEEEKRYMSLQHEYLDLLKKQDELLKDYKGELKVIAHAVE